MNADLWEIPAGKSMQDMVNQGDGIDFGFSRVRNNSMSYLLVSSSFATITTIGDKTDSIGVTYEDKKLSNDGYFMGPISGSRFIITKIDFQDQIISGEFEFILREIKNVGTVTDNFITLKEGRFDFKFNACKCSN